MVLAIDIGNTLAKLTVVDRGRVVAVRRTPEPSVEAARELFEAWPIDAAVMIWAREAEELKAYIREAGGRRPEAGLKSGYTDSIEQIGDSGSNKECGRQGVRAEQSSGLRPPVSGFRFLEVTWATPIPIESGYVAPEHQGADRVAAMVGASVLFPGRDVLVADLGTAITFDLLSAGGRFVGGNISPGAWMRLRALGQFTRGVPTFERMTARVELIAGSSLEGAVVSGVVNAIVYEAEGYIERLRALHPDLQVIFTGGDADFFAERVKSPIFVESNLVALGLNRILEYNAK